ARLAGGRRRICWAGEIASAGADAFRLHGGAMARHIRPFRGPDGTNWGVEVREPGASNAMIVFHHPGGKTARLDRYAWDIWSGPESRSVTSRVAPEKIMQSLTDEKLSRLFRRSMPVSNSLSRVDKAS